MRDERNHLSDECLLRGLDGELAADDDASLRLHLADCEPCRERMRQVEGVSRALDALGESLAVPEGNQRAALVSALAGAPVPQKGVRYGWLSAAAAVVTAAGIWLMLSAKAPEAERHTAAAGGFIALPYSDDSMASEGAVVLQVELPRMALVLAGMPAGDVPSDGRVRAEVLVGADGLARGIRFIN